MPASPVIIKKYENRRLYDTSNSRYVNLDDIAQMVRDGIEVQVLDAVSGEDITRLVLTQIVMENAKGPNSAFPLDILRQMIVTSGQASQESVLGYMRAVAEMYQNTYRALTPALTPFGFPAPNSEPVTSERRPGKERERAPEPQPSVEELRRRVEDLERLIAKKTKAGGAAKRKRATRQSK